MPTQLDSSESTGEIYLDNQHSPPELSYNPGVCDGERLWLLEEPYQLGPRVHFDHAQGTSASVDVGGHPNQSLSGPVDVEGKQQIRERETAESPPVEINDIGIRNPKKRKREATPDSPGEGREGKRTRRRKPRDPKAPQEYIPVGTSGIGIA